MGYIINPYTSISASGSGFVAGGEGDLTTSEMQLMLLLLVDQVGVEI